MKPEVADSLGLGGRFHIFDDKSGDKGMIRER